MHAHPKSEKERRQSGYHRQYPKNLILDLMSIAHMYEVKDLEMDCTEYLMKNIDDDKVMEIWMEAVKFNITALCEAAIKRLVVRPKGNPLREVPGFTETF